MSVGAEFHREKCERSARLIQLFLASVFLLLGGWCLLMPNMVEQLVFRPEYQHFSATSNLFMGCFGAQAVLVSVVISCSKFTAKTFLVFGLVGSIPFFIFNYHFYFTKQMFTDWMLLDFVGNLIILGCGLIGWQLLRKS